VLHHQVVGDNEPRIVEAIELAASRADVVIVTGGLGPTQDDVTRPALAEAVGARLVRHAEIEDALREAGAPQVAFGGEGPGVTFGGPEIPPAAPPRAPTVEPSGTPPPPPGTPDA